MLNNFRPAPNEPHEKVANLWLANCCFAHISLGFLLEPEGST
jgi:hypothetical protein